MDYKIYDNWDEKWLGINFAEFEDAENHVTDELGDVDFERYSIYQLISGFDSQKFRKGVST